MKTSLTQLLGALFCDLPRRGGTTTSSPRGAGLATALVLAITGFAVGSQSYLQNQNQAQFHQGSFSPAVSLACTGHINQVTGNEKVDAFLSDPNGTLESCEGVDAARSIYWNVFDTASLYLYLLTALVWMFLGFSWSSLSAVAGLFAAGFAVGAYLFVRCFTSSRLLAFALALAVLFAPVALGQMPHLRDFSKAPLILLGLGLIGRTVFSAVSFRGALSLAGCIGVLIGLGSGLRPDGILLVPIALATFVLLWRGGEGWRGRTMQILSASLALCVGYAIASAPVGIVNDTKGVTSPIGAHVLLLGLAEPFQDSLGFQPGNYVLLRDYVDEHVQALVNLHHSGVGAAPIDHSLDPAYGPASYALFAEMLAAAPHDALMRVFATANALGAYPLNNLVYGPLLTLLLAVGFILLPRRALFYSISAAVIVPVLSLQFHQRHAFYAVVFGAAALGFAYTLAAMATTAMVNRNEFAWPSRTTVLTRTAFLAASMGTFVVLVYAADHFAIGHQQRALAALHQVYRSADWSPIEMVQGGSGLRFPTLTPTPERRAGVMALSFDFTDPEPTDGVIGDLKWQRVGTARAAPFEDGFRFTSNDVNGYQFVSRPILISELSVPGNGSESRVLSLRMRGTSDSTAWTIGALSHDQSRWIDIAPVPSGTFDHSVVLQVPHTEQSVQLVWALAEARTSILELNKLVIRNSSALQGCTPAPWSIAPLHTYANGSSIGTPMAIAPAQSGTYYFPFSQMSIWSFESVKINGTSARCVTNARIAKSLPPHTLPIEFVEVDGQFNPTKRAGWGMVLRDFARWQRPARY